MKSIQRLCLGVALAAAGAILGCHDDRAADDKASGVTNMQPAEPNPVTTSTDSRPQAGKTGQGDPRGGSYSGSLDDGHDDGGSKAGPQATDSVIRPWSGNAEPKSGDGFSRAPANPSDDNTRTEGGATGL